ncbi:uncharacterized protein LOC124269189 [Haliotis rubra]|uniref:uncharacterized protein LOC124269189 n=1 Tax=Haliotis rubra TaxID=36100 RepID=UPI001EE52340|nr:uncharacterized protein LOC124269189 [Haliotis rubra]
MTSSDTQLIRIFMFSFMQPEVISASGHVSRGEGADFILEASNRRVKMWMPPGVPTEHSWRRSCRNLDKLEKMLETVLGTDHDAYQFSTVNEDSLQCEILGWRRWLRRVGHFKQPMEIQPHSGFHPGDLLDLHLPNAEVTEAHKSLKSKTKPEMVAFWPNSKLWWMTMTVLVPERAQYPFGGCTEPVRACSRDGFTTDKVNKYTYLCSKHFVGGNGPSFEHPDPIPATYTSDQVVHFSKKRKNPVERRPLPSKVSRLDPTSTAGDDGLSLLAVCAADHPYTSRKHPEDQETICTELNVCDIEETALTEHSSSDAACQATPSTQDMSSQAEFVCSSILVSKIYEKMTAQVPDSDCGISRNLDNKTCDLLFDNLVCNKKKFKYYTGMKTVHFNHLFSSLGDSVNEICYWRGNKMNSNKSGKCRVLTVKDQLVLTLVRLRRNLPTKDLSYRYNISVGSVSCIITT